METRICATCRKEIDSVKEGYLKVLDNFLLTKYFDEIDGSDNIFCSDECVLQALSVEHFYDENNKKNKESEI